MSAGRKSAIVIGGGVAGLAAAVFLDELGFNVTLVEKKPHLGGRTYSFCDRVTGFEIDNGQHLLIGAYHETFKFLEAISAKGRVAFHSPTIIPLADEESRLAFFRVREGRPPLPLLSALMRFKHLGWREKATFLRLGLALRKIRQGKTPVPAGLTVTDWLKGLGQGERVRRLFWDIITLATLNDAPDLTSADGLVQVMLGGFFQGPRDGLLVFPTVGLSDLFANPAAEYLRLRGQKIRTDCGVQEIRFLSGRAMAAVLEGGEVLKADIFVSALPFRQLLNVLPRPLLDATPALARLGSLTSAPIVSINLFYDRPVMAETFLGSAATRVHWFFRRDGILKDRSETSAGRPSNPSHIVGVVSGAYDLLDLSKQEIVAIATAELARLCPRTRQANLVHALVNKEREATLSSRIGVNALRPAQKILENFFVVGDWTRTGLPATIESAVKSARLMADTVR